MRQRFPSFTYTSSTMGPCSVWQRPRRAALRGSRRSRGGLAPTGNRLWMVRSATCDVERGRVRRPRSGALVNRIVRRLSWSAKGVGEEGCRSGVWRRDINQPVRPWILRGRRSPQDLLERPDRLGGARRMRLRSREAREFGMVALGVSGHTRVVHANSPSPDGEPLGR